MRIRFLSLVMFGYVLSGIMSCSENLEKTLSEADSLAYKGDAKKVIQHLEALQEDYIKDTTATLRIMARMSDIYGGILNDYQGASQVLERMVSTYPDRPETPASLFKLAFTYETMIKDLHKARTMYERFLSSYPNHELAQSVRVNLEHLGETEDEMLRRILEKAGMDSLGEAKK